MFKSKNQFQSITVNGKTIQCSGSNVVIRNGKIIVDNTIVYSDMTGHVEVVVNGDVNKLDCSGSVEVHGNSGDIDCGGSCTVGGDVNGNIDAGGSVRCGNVSGDIDAGGSVSCKR